MLNCVKLRTSPLNSGTRQGCPLSSLLFNIILESHSNQQEREIKGIQIGREEVKLSPFAEAMILYTENHKDLVCKLLELINESSKGTSLVVQWLGLHTSTTQGTGSILGQGVHTSLLCNAAKKKTKQQRNSVKWQDIRLTYLNLLHFFILTMKYQKEKAKKKKIPFKTAC